VSELEPSSPRGMEVTPGHAGTLLRPEFVIVGIAVAGGVLLFGSTTLDDAQLRRRIVGIDRVPLRHGGGPIARIPKEKITLTVGMRDFIQVYGETYPEALRTLLGEWDRQRKWQERTALPPGEI
jgi:hypothetical protein